MRLASAVAALLRRVRAERGVVTFLFLLVAATSFVVAAGPRSFNRVADDGLQYEVAGGTAIERNLQFSSIDRLPSTPGDPLGRLASRGASIQGQLPDSVERLIDETHYIVDVTRFQLADAPRLPTLVTLRQQDELADHADLVAGRWPERVVAGETPSPGEFATFEVALSDAAAAATDIAVGDAFPATVDLTDPLLRTAAARPIVTIRIEIVGLFAVRDPAARYWFDDRSTGDVVIAGTDEAPTAIVAGIFAAAAYPDLIRRDLPMAYRWNMLVDDGRLDAGELDVLVTDLRRLETRFATTTVRPNSVLFRSGLLSIVERYLDRRATTEAVLSVAALGPVTVVAGAVGLIGVLVVRRRRPALALVRGRGGSRSQILATQLWEGLLITVPAVLLGWWLALAAVSARPSVLSSVGSVLVALGVTGLLLVATWPIASRARRDLDRDDPPVFRIGPRRLVFEILIVGLSATSAWLLRERGLEGAGVAAKSGFDPFLAASPLLIGLAVGLLTIRLYPLPVLGLGWFMARRRDLVPVLGLRNLGRHPTTGYLPLLILMLTVAIGTFSSVLQVSIERSQVEVAWQEVGGDYRISSASGGPLDAGVDPGRIAGVEGVATGVIVTNQQISTGPGRAFGVYFEAVESAAYDAVLAGSPVAPDLPGTFRQPPAGPGIGTTEQPIPAALSTRLPSRGDPLAIGDAFEANVQGQLLKFRVEALLTSFPGIPRSQSFLIVPFESVAAARQGRPLRPTVFFVRGSLEAADSLRAALGSGPGTPSVVSRYERYARMHDAPLVAAVVGGFAVALVVAGAYAALAVIAVAILHAQRRSRELAFLRTLGLNDRQAAALTLLEQGLPVLFALAIGVALGLGLARLLAPGIDLAAFSSRDATVLLQVEWASVAGVAVAVVAMVAVAIGASSWLARRLNLGQALRIGEE